VKHATLIPFLAIYRFVRPWCCGPALSGDRAEPITWIRSLRNGVVRRETMNYRNPCDGSTGHSFRSRSSRSRSRSSCRWYARALERIFELVPRSSSVRESGLDASPPSLATVLIAQRCLEAEKRIKRRLRVYGALSSR